MVRWVIIPSAFNKLTSTCVANKLKDAHRPEYYFPKGHDDIRHALKHVNPDEENIRSGWCYRCTQKTMDHCVVWLTTQPKKGGGISYADLLSWKFWFSGESLSDHQLNIKLRCICVKPLWTTSVTTTENLHFSSSFAQKWPFFCWQTNSSL